ncbi:cytochrome p450 [Moniliophthora roreri MCA 2997]|uniref:Cytochrome p450 n=1 Tax=Moniliophthora roreri (strain MCA 2997) TaxID=1381753 RepID=V2X7T1_MONRO|nr:cytochrome p450 [Moniliophthora roreri MCA 2997]
MALSTLVAALLISCMLVILFVRSKSRSIGILRGPPRFSRLFGYELELLHQENVGDHEFQWVDEYGSAFRVPDVYGTDSLWLVDPRALQHILHTSGYNYTTPRDVDFDLRGASHQRQRRVLNPAFSLGHLRQFSSVFQFYASKLVKRIEDQIFIKPSEPVDMAKLIPKLTLDVIGETGFSYHFGALDDETTELSEKLLHIFDDSKMPTKFQVLMKSLRRYLPPVISEMTRVLPTKEDIRFAEFHHTADRIAENLVKEKEKEQRIQNNTTGSDILDILYHSNNAEDPKKRITNEELISQLSTLVLAGHDTTAFSIAWFLYELSAHPQDQRKIMEEIKAARAQSRTGEFTISDYDSMTHLNASMKEVLRLHPIVNRFVREAGRDDVLPLQFPVTTRNGEVVDNIPVKKGQRIEIAIAPYNRFAAVWGKDAHDFRPSRFLDIDTKKQTALGLYNNLMSFSAGVKACIGWRFAIVEIQTVIVGLLERLEFSLPEGGLDMQRPPGLVMHPIVKGKEEEGPHLPLVVRPRVI